MNAPQLNLTIAPKRLCNRAPTCWLIGLLSLIVLPLGQANDTAAGKPKAALTVTVAKTQLQEIDQVLSANGNIMPWQEAIIGTEASGLRLTDVKVNVGDLVKRGQVLAVFSADTVSAELSQLEANLAEAEANAAEANANALRAKSVEKTGALSEQQISQYTAAEKTAQAKLLAQRAAVNRQKLRLAQTQVLAPDSGIISSRKATLGAVLGAGEELFRLIRQSRLEWRAEVTAAELASLNEGTSVTIQSANGDAIKGSVRMIAPTVNPESRLGLVFVDLPKHAHLRAGMYVTGAFHLGNAKAITVSQQAVVVRDGFNYMFCLQPDQHVRQVKVVTGRRHDEQIEIVSGLPENSEFVVKGAGFLNDGDLVQVVPTVTASQSKP